MKAIAVVLLAAVAIAAGATSGVSAQPKPVELFGVGSPCKRSADCGGLRCNQATGKCERACTKAGASCKADVECCSSTCSDGVCLCFSHGAQCTWGSECCDGSCSAEKGCCRTTGNACEVDGQCCSGVCRAPGQSILLEADAETEADAKPKAAKGNAKAKGKGNAKGKGKGKFVAAAKRCCGDFGQKCDAEVPCCAPYICADAIGMCTLAPEPKAKAKKEDF